jgi:hypothetical protein
MMILKRNIIIARDNQAYHLVIDHLVVLFDYSHYML